MPHHANTGLDVFIKKLGVHFGILYTVDFFCITLKF